jgi:ABC-type antimicrobial peptide transport system permease subunit
VLGTVLRGAALQTAAGVAIGLPLAAMAGQRMQAQLFRVTWNDPLVLTAALSLLVGCALLAALLPARRAASMDPMQALRTE